MGPELICERDVPLCHALMNATPLAEDTVASPFAFHVVQECAVEHSRDSERIFNSIADVKLEARVQAEAARAIPDVRKRLANHALLLAK